MCPTSADVQQYIRAKFLSLCPRNADWCDGVNLDYVRFIEVRDLVNSSRSDSCYCKRCQELFLQEAQGLDIEKYMNRTTPQKLQEAIKYEELVSSKGLPKNAVIQKWRS